MKRFSFPKNKRLVSNRQFKAVLERNMRFSDDLLTLYIARNNCGYARLGVSVSRSLGGAVVRNRAKRLLREAFRQSQGRIPSGFDYLFMISSGLPKRIDKQQGARKAMKQLTFERVRSSFVALVAAAEKQIAIGRNKQDRSADN